MPELRKFHRSTVTQEPVPIVVVRQRGDLGLNLKAFEVLGSPRAVELYCDPDELVIGLKGAERNSPNSYSLRKLGNYRFECAGRAFLTHYGIPIGEVGKKRYRAEMVDGVLQVNLKQHLGDS